MLNFENDYSEGAHEAILARLAETNLVKQPGYGFDEYSESARQKIRAACKCPEADVFFLVGGTQTNAVVIASILGRCEGVIAADTAHIAGHEAGAIEYTGHKVLQIPNHDGKISAVEVGAFMRNFQEDANHEHMVQPKMVYISHPSEYGTLYTKAELQELRDVCDEYGLQLFIDGARLAYALACPSTDVSLQDIAVLTDVFYIGGTKAGALCGEAVVFPHGAPRHFFSMVKQQGALLAKGRLVGVQFDVLFTDNLYLRCGANAIAAADNIRKSLREAGYRFLSDNPTNQIFLVLSDAQLADLEGQVRLGFWEKLDDDHTVMRIATSWATTQADVDALIAALV